MLRPTTLLLLVALVIHAQKLQLEREYKLADSVPVYGLAFSRDGKRIAIAVGRSSSEQLLEILDVETGQGRRLNVNPSLPDSRFANAFFDWSLTGTHLLVAGQMIEVATARSCQSNYGMFAGPDLAIAHMLRPSEFLQIGLDCQVLTQQPVPAGLRIGWFNASAERGLLVVASSKIEGFLVTESTEILVHTARMESLRTIARWKRDGEGFVFDKVVFAEGGQTLCGVKGPVWTRTVECSEVDAGTVIHSSRSWSDPVLRPALNASRVVISEWGRKFDWIELGWAAGQLKRRTVWDYRSNRKVVSWKPPLQRIEGREIPYAFDISPDGRYIVEAGAGTVKLYRIEPGH